MKPITLVNDADINVGYVKNGQLKQKTLKGTGKIRVLDDKLLKELNKRWDRGTERT